MISTKNALLCRGSKRAHQASPWQRPRSQLHRAPVPEPCRWLRPSFHALAIMEG
jgi:hypothetical protein